MTEKTYTVLFLCTGNSAHSIPSEACLQATRYLTLRVEKLLMLSFGLLDEMSLRSRLKEVGRNERDEPVEMPLESAGRKAAFGWA